MKGNTIVSAGQAWGPSPSLVSRKPAGEGQPFLTLESYLSSPTYAVPLPRVTRSRGPPASIP